MHNHNNTLNKLKYAEWNALILDAKERCCPDSQTDIKKEQLRTYLKENAQLIYEQLFSVSRDYSLTFDPRMVETLEEKNPRKLWQDLFYETILLISERDLPTNKDEKWSNLIFILNTMKKTAGDLRGLISSGAAETNNVELIDARTHLGKLSKATINTCLSFMTQYPQLFGEDGRFPTGEIQVVCEEKKGREWTLAKQTLVWDLASGQVSARIKIPEFAKAPASGMSLTEENQRIPFGELEGYIGTVYKVMPSKYRDTSGSRDTSGTLVTKNLSQETLKVDFPPAFTLEVVFQFMDQLIDKYNLENQSK